MIEVTEEMSGGLRHHSDEATGPQGSASAPASPEHGSEKHPFKCLCHGIEVADRHSHPYVPRLGMHLTMARDAKRDQVLF